MLIQSKKSQSKNVSHFSLVGDIQLNGFHLTSLIPLCLFLRFMLFILFFEKIKEKKAKVES